MRYGIFELETSKNSETIKISCSVIWWFMNMSEYHFHKFMKYFNPRTFIGHLYSHDSEYTNLLLKILKKGTEAENTDFNFLSFEFIEFLRKLLMSVCTKTRVITLEFLNNLILADSGKYFGFFNNANFLNDLRFLIQKDPMNEIVRNGLFSLVVFLNNSNFEEVEQIITEYKLVELVFQTMQKTNYNVIIKNLDLMNKILEICEKLSVELNSEKILKSMKSSEFLGNFESLCSNEEEKIRNYANKSFDLFLSLANRVSLN